MEVGMEGREQQKAVIIARLSLLANASRPDSRAR
jgi:hypothetical protein